MGRVPTEGGLDGLRVQFTEQGYELLEGIRSIKVIDEETFIRLATMGRIGKKIAKAIEDQFEKAVKGADQAHKDILRIKRLAMENFVAAEKECKDRMLAAHQQLPGVEVPGTVFSNVWRAEVTDEALVPSEYKIPDVEKIQKMATALGDECKIPGVRVYRRTQVSIRGE